MNVVDHKCLGCGAPLEFNTNTQNWICRYCNKIYDISGLEQNINKFNATRLTNVDVYVCDNCGAKVMGNNSTSATKCLYCGNSVIIKKNLDGIYKPDYIITFKRKKEEIINSLCNELKSKFFSDKKFSNKNNIKEVTQLYVPYWLLSCNVMASIKGIYFVQTRNSTINKMCYRLGNMSFNRVPADGKTNLNDELLQGIEPFNYDELLPFEYPYLAGMVAECYDINEQEIVKIQIKQRIEEAAEDKLSKTISGGKNNFSVHERSTFINNEKFEYVLVPIWLVKLEYQGITYEYCINDQTKKIAGIKQVSKKKVSIVYSLATLLSLLLCFLAKPAITNYYAGSEYIILGLILLIISIFTGISTNIRGYKKIKKGKNSVDYVNQGSFVLTDSYDRDSF